MPSVYCSLSIVEVLLGNSHVWFFGFCCTTIFGTPETEWEREELDQLCLACAITICFGHVLVFILDMVNSCVFFDHIRHIYLFQWQSRQKALADLHQMQNVHVSTVLIVLNCDLNTNKSDDCITCGSEF